MKIDVPGNILAKDFNRRGFIKGTGIAGLGITAMSILAGLPLHASDGDDDGDNRNKGGDSKNPADQDSVAQIFTAALIAEDLATTFYYNGLVGAVIQDPNLAGSGGTATAVTSDGNAGNVNYLQAALTEEIDHANLLRSLLGISSAAKDPVQTFYFPTGSFDTLSAFTGLLDALENAFIGAYLTAVQEFAHMASDASSKPPRGRGADKSKYTSTQLEYFAKVSASIMGIESEHRVLGRVISNTNPANNLAYEQTDGLTAVYNGPHSAVVALTPFLTASTGPGYSFATALAEQGNVSLPVTGGPPSS
ncbi:MAG: ferritin-like domain-containing protein [Terriglobales bacterium]